MIAMKQDKWKPSSRYMLRSEHFEQTCFGFYSSQVRLREAFNLFISTTFPEEK